MRKIRGGNRLGEKGKRKRETGGGRAVMKSGTLCSQDSC
jgi:hypothetical protein